ncbi:Os01g0388400 [Oryza sativa Japonica Group]|uniref:Os01g0388400 protein n=1 Tax=Oryza sativa subsp. japonica TaxID=39947 RepID=A0A0P0V2W1_ORYSJ|nr:Os01g0388400 [Oryza sativa Japonica Group]
MPDLRPTCPCLTHACEAYRVKPNAHAHARRARACPTGTHCARAPPMDCLCAGSSVYGWQQHGRCPRGWLRSWRRRRHHELPLPSPALTNPRRPASPPSTACVAAVACLSRPASPPAAARAACSRCRLPALSPSPARASSRRRLLPPAHAAAAIACSRWPASPPAAAVTRPRCRRHRLLAPARVRRHLPAPP